MSSVALGVTVFTRTLKLEQLLNSVEYPIEKVYVADVGDINSERERVYSKPYSFELEVIDLEHGTGLGHGRNEIVNHLSEDYLLIVDSDNTVPHNVDLLIKQLEARPEFGGISGLIFEGGNIVGACCDLYEEHNLLIKDIRGTKDTQFVADAPLVEFDFVPNITMFRKDCLDDYSWDPRYTIGKEHEDFYVAHKKRTNWKFGTCPSVIFPHFPGGDQSYMSARESKKELRESKTYFLEKWKYRQLVWIQGRWVESFSDPKLRGWRHLVGLGTRIGIRHLPSGAKAKIMDAVDYARYRDRSLDTHLYPSIFKN